MNKPVHNASSKSSTFSNTNGAMYVAMTLGGVVMLGAALNVPLLIPPLAATAAYIFGAPNTPGTQPRSVVAGHLVAALVGFGALSVFGGHAWVAVVAASLSMIVMNKIRLFHIPSVATAALVVLIRPTHWIVFILELLLGAVAICVMGYAISKITREIDYPVYW